MVVSEFIAGDGTVGATDWFAMCGPACVGKSYFMGRHGMVSHRKLKKLFKQPTLTEWLNNGNFHWALASHPKRWPKEQLTEAPTKTTKAIVIGIPYFIWKKRIQERILRHKEFHTSTHVYLKLLNATAQYYKKIYVKWIKVLDEYNIPYILVDNRNNYPILDKSSFFTMLGEKDKL